MSRWLTSHGAALAGLALVLVACTSELPEATGPTPTRPTTSADVTVPDVSGDVAEDAVVDVDTTADDTIDGDEVVDADDGIDAPDLTDADDTTDGDAAEVDAVDPTWWNPAWSRRVTLTVDNTGGVELTDFPLLVTIAEDRLDDLETQDGGEDLRFVLPDTLERLDHEIESWSESNPSFVWVRVPSIPADATMSIDLYHGNPDAAALAAPVAQGVWLDYDAVLHLQGPVLVDATGGGHDAVAVGGPTNVRDGRIGGAVDLDGDDDALDLSASEGINYASALTVSAWIQVDAFTDEWQAIVTKGDSSWRLHRNETSSAVGLGVTPADGSGNDNVGGETDVTDGSWHHVAATFDGATLRVYVDGMLDGEMSWDKPTATNDLRVSIGRNVQADPQRWFDGRIDEVRLSSVWRDEAWIAAQHRSMTDQMVSWP